MKTYAIIGLVLFCPILGLAQQLEKTVIASSGETTVGTTVTVEQVIGEPLVVNRQGTNTQISEGFLQGYKLKVQPLSRKKGLPNEPTLQVYPNPTTSFVTVNGITSNAFSIMVLDAQGKNIKTQNNNNTVDFTNTAAGTYILQVLQNNEQIGVYQIIKE